MKNGEVRPEWNSGIAPRMEGVRPDWNSGIAERMEGVRGKA